VRRRQLGLVRVRFQVRKGFCLGLDLGLGQDLGGRPDASAPGFAHSASDSLYIRGVSNARCWSVSCAAAAPCCTHGPSPILLPCRAAEHGCANETVALRNVGRETESFLWFIVQRYDSLAEYTLGTALAAAAMQTSPGLASAAEPLRGARNGNGKPARSLKPLLLFGVAALIIAAGVYPQVRSPSPHTAPRCTSAARQGPHRPVPHEADLSRIPARSCQRDRRSRRRCCGSWPSPRTRRSSRAVR